jgi:hypothetical protein
MSKRREALLDRLAGTNKLPPRRPRWREYLVCDAHGVRLDRHGHCVTGGDGEPPRWHQPDTLDCRIMREAVR